MKFTPIKNKAQLKRLLIIPNLRKETIYSIIGRMEVLLDYLQKEEVYHGLIPFLKTYYYVTKASSDKYVLYKRYFWNIKDHEILDVHFASLYFKPVFGYLEGGIIVKPWEHYFHYCRKNSGIPFLQMLLGINAHINTDLYLSLVSLKYQHQHDFFLVNDILQEVIPKVLKFLTFSEHDILGATGLVMKGFIINEFHNIVERWRSDAWINAQFTNRQNRKSYYEKIVQSTERIGEKLIKDFTDMYHLRNFSEVGSNINSLSVRVV